jgi:predicted Rossmann fold nucleotide-binding protein DprA/Smf involved in DNA uptake
MKLIIAGSRTIQDYNVTVAGFSQMLYEYPSIHIDTIISGCADGPDTHGIQIAKMNGLHVKKFPANWAKDGKKAGFIRNEKMAAYGDMLLAIWDGKSSGTKHMISCMSALGKPVYIYPKPLQNKLANQQ